MKRFQDFEDNGNNGNNANIKVFRQSSDAEHLVQKNAIARLSEELSLSEENVFIFICEHLTEAQKKKLLTENSTPEEYNRILEDVFVALELTDDQITALAGILSIPDDAIAEFSKCTKLSGNIPLARRLLVDLYRYRIFFDRTRVCLAYQYGDAIRAEYGFFEKGTVRKGFELARADSKTFQGFKSFYILKSKYMFDGNTSSSSDFIENVFLYLWCKYTTKLTLSDNDKLVATGTKAGKDRFIHGGYINITQPDALNKTYNAILYKQKGSLNQIKKNRVRTKIDQKGDLSPEEAIVYADAYIKSYSNVFWKMVVILNQRGTDQTEHYDVTRFKSTLRAPYEVPQTLLDALKENEAHYAGQIKTFLGLTNRASKSIAFPCMSESDWKGLINKECERLNHSTPEKEEAVSLLCLFAFKSASVAVTQQSVAGASSVIAPTSKPSADYK